jgi:hypothetical protein
MKRDIADLHSDVPDEAKVISDVPLWMLVFNGFVSHLHPA